MIALCDARAFAPWLDTAEGRRSEQYLELKGRIEKRLVARFCRHFPALAPLIHFHELSTPLTQQRYLRSPGGAMYGLEMTATRLTTAALRVRTARPRIVACWPGRDRAWRRRGIHGRPDVSGRHRAGAAQALWQLGRPRQGKKDYPVLLYARVPESVVNSPRDS